MQRRARHLVEKFLANLLDIENSLTLPPAIVKKKTKEQV